MLKICREGHPLNQKGYMFISLQPTIIARLTFEGDRTMAKKADYKKIASVVGDDRVTDDPVEIEMYGHGVVAPLPKEIEIPYKMKPDLVVRPKTAKEVQKIMRYAKRSGIPVVPRGGASWAGGGATPAQGGILLDLTSMNEIIDFDPDNFAITVGAGATWEEVHEFLLDKGYLLGAHPTSAPAATIGGWIGVGGSGAGSYKYGCVGDQVLSMEVVTPTGRVIETGYKDVCYYSSGYNLNWLYVGAEGTLGVTTKVTLKVRPGPEVIKPLSYGFNGIDDVCEAINAVNRSPITPWHMSFANEAHFKFREMCDLHVPPSPNVFNATLEGTEAEVEVQERKIDEMVARIGGDKFDLETAQAEWEDRMYEMEAKRKGPTVMLAEVYVPTSRLNEAIDRVAETSRSMGMEAAQPGMVVSGNSTLLMPYALTDERKLIEFMLTTSFPAKCSEIAMELGGRPAGLGLWFSHNMLALHDEREVSIMKDVKDALDPAHVMNPGKTLENVGRFGMPTPAPLMALGMNIFGKMKKLI